MNIGNQQLGENPLFLAPMHEVTDIPFRQICKRLGADVVMTEFVSVEALIRHIDKARLMMHIRDDERPVGAQIFGKNDASFVEAAQIITEQFRPDFIDLNAGCAAGKHAARGECAGLLRDLPLFEKIARATVQATHLPVTVKTRLGWDMNSLVVLDVAKMVEQAGAKALIVHCRTRSQGYKVPADWTWLEKIKKVISIPLIGNGDVVAPQDAKRMFETGCDGVMIGRGALANPWIFRETAHFLKTGQLLPLPTLQERIHTCIDHLKLYAEFKRTHSGLYAFRKFYTGYLKGMPGAAGLRAELMRLTELTDIESCLKEFLKENQVDTK
jgi:nifR3 family TIM-barrel protein